MAHQPDLDNETQAKTQASNAKQRSTGKCPKWKDRAKTWRTNLPSGDEWYQKLGSDDAIHDLCDRLTLRHVHLEEGLSFDQLFDQCIEQYATLEEDWKFFAEMVFSGACIVALHYKHPKDAIHDSLRKLLQHPECSEKYLKETLRRGALCGRLVDIVVMKKGSVAYKLPYFEGRGKGELSTRTLLRDCPEDVFPYLEDRIDREQADSDSKQANEKTSRELHIARLVWRLLGRYSYEDVCKILGTRPTDDERPYQSPQRSSHDMCGHAMRATQEG
ncbi:hypothetical protein LRP88_11568 [Fusarium phalaenopsidis]